MKSLLNRLCTDVKKGMIAFKITCFKILIVQNVNHGSTAEDPEHRCGVSVGVDCSKISD